MGKFKRERQLRRMADKQERQLRQQWQKAHEHVHKLERMALRAALRAANQRLDGMNELRDQINTERINYVMRENFDAVNSSTDGRLKMLENKGSLLDGKMWVVGAIVTMIGLVLYFVGKVPR